MSLPEGYSVRPATEADLEAMVSLANAYDIVDLGEPDTAIEHLADPWRASGFDVERDTWLAHAPDGGLVAFGLLRSTPGEVLESWGRVHPQHRGRGLGTFLVAAMEARAAERRAPVRLHNGVTSTDAAARALLEGCGYELARFFWHMERDLTSADLEAPPDPPDIRVRLARDGSEIEAAGAALDEAFRDHWSWEPEPFEEWVAFLRDSGERVVVAVDGSEVAGVVTFRSIGSVGWVDELGVRRPWRGHGLGALLLRHAFAGLAETGALAVRLNVDADNRTGATRLYERAGMRVRREWLVFEKRFSPG